MVKNVALKIPKHHQPRFSQNLEGEGKNLFIFISLFRKKKDVRELTRRHAISEGKKSVVSPIEFSIKSHSVV